MAGWQVGVEGTTIEEVVAKAKVEAEKQWPGLVAFAVNTTGEGVGVKYFSEACFDAEGNLATSDQWDVYVFDKGIAAKNAKEKQILESREPSTAPGRRTKKMRDAELQLEMEERKAAEERFKVEEQWAKRECKGEKVYCLKEAEGYFLAAKETKEELEAFLAQSEQQAEVAYGKYTKMIATGKLRAVPIIRAQKGSPILTKPSRSDYVFRVSFRHEGRSEPQAEADPNADLAAQAQADAKQKRRRDAMEEAERQRLLAEQAREEAEMAAFAAEAEREAAEAEAARHAAAVAATKLREAQAQADAEELAKLERQLEEAKLLAAEERRQANVARERAAKEAEEANEARQASLQAAERKAKQDSMANRYMEERMHQREERSRSRSAVRSPAEKYKQESVNEKKRGDRRGEKSSIDLQVERMMANYSGD